MTPADDWLEQYGRGRIEADTDWLAWICVPLSVIGLTGLIWSLPVPESLSQSSDVLNWGTLFLMASVVYYFIVSINLAFGILPFIVADVAAVSWLENFDIPLWSASGVLLTLAISAQFLGEHLRGLQVHIVRDLQYLMLAPLWLLAAVYRRLGIPY
jgi:hypothetical protein